MRLRIIGVMGPGRLAQDHVCKTAYQIGKLIASAGHTLLTGGVSHGVMDAASRGAKEAGGLTIGVLPHKQPSETHPISDHVDIPIITSFGEGRNVINALSCDVVVAIGMCPGTASEVCFAIKALKPVILLESTQDTWRFFQYVLNGNVQVAESPEAAGQMIERLLASNAPPL